MPEELSDADEKLVAKANVAKVKTESILRSLCKAKHVLGARKKDYTSQNMGTPKELTQFLHSNETYEKVCAMSGGDWSSIIVRR